MAAGEYASVHSQADTEQAELELESAELKTDDKGEHKELMAIYVALRDVIVQPALRRFIIVAIGFDRLPTGLGGLGAFRHPLDNVPNVYVGGHMTHFLLLGVLAVMTLLWFVSRRRALRSTAE